MNLKFTNSIPITTGSAMNSTTIPLYLHHSHYIYTIPIISTPFPLNLHHSHIYIIPIKSTPFPLYLHHSHIYIIPIISTPFPLNLHHSHCTCIYTIPSPNRIHYSRTVLSNNIKCYHIQYMYVPFQQWNCTIPSKPSIQFSFI